MKNQGPLRPSCTPTHLELCAKKFQNGKQDRKNVPGLKKFSVDHVYSLSDHQINHITEDWQ